MAGKPFPYNVPVNGRYGAPMGRPSGGQGHEEYQRLTLRRVPLYDGCYDKGGAYWGGPSDLWCAWSPSRDVVRFVRAMRYWEAEHLIREEFPSADFLRG